jgi:flagellar P-ring protein precursor FlgI
LVLTLLILASIPAAVMADRIKDLASIAGVRSNQLVGYGLVVGLNGTGDNTKFTSQSVKNMLLRLGITLPPNMDPKSKNVASVMVSAELPPFAKNGQTLDVTVSTVGKAKSLHGGTLILTPLKGADGEVYALAQGSLVVSGFGAQGADGSSVTVNVPSVARIPNGATVERTVSTDFTKERVLVLNLHDPDFTTAHRVALAINNALGPETAEPLDSTSIKVIVPVGRSHRVGFVSLLENLPVVPAEAPAEVIVSARTGTVVIGQHVRVSPAAVSHGNLVVTISESPEVSQPAPFARRGRTEVVPQSGVEVTEQPATMFLFDPGVSLNEIVEAVNQVGAAPSDLVAILEALKRAGALHAKLSVI